MEHLAEIGLRNFSSILQSNEIEKSIGTIWVNQFHTASFFLYLLKTSENLWFFDIFRGYRKRSMT